MLILIYVELIEIAMSASFIHVNKVLNANLLNYTEEKGKSCFPSLGILAE